MMKIDSLEMMSTMCDTKYENIKFYHSYITLNQPWWLSGFVNSKFK